MKIKGRTVIREHPRFCCSTQKQRENLPDQQIAQNIVNKRMKIIFNLFDDLFISWNLSYGRITIKEVYDKFLTNYM